MTSAQAPAIPHTGKLREPQHPRTALLAWLLEHRAQLLASFALAALGTGAVLHLIGAGSTGDSVWRAAVALLAAELAYEVGRTVVVDHHLGVDAIALVAMVGALALGQELAGAVVGLMFSGGEALEAAASRRARRELTALAQRAPKVAHVRAGERSQGGTGRAKSRSGTWWWCAGRGDTRRRHGRQPQRQWWTPAR